MRYSKLKKNEILREIVSPYRIEQLIRDVTPIQLPHDTTPLLLLGDVTEWLKKIPSESISCIVTSPPYWKHRNYYDDRQIGQESSSEHYVDKMVQISRELLRILKKDGAYFLNIGDTYDEQGLGMIPQKVALKMLQDVKLIGKNKKKIGWLLRNQIIWHKPNHMPSPAKCRFTNTYEPIFFFTRADWERDVYFNLDAIRVPYKSSENVDQLEFPEFLTEQEYKRWISRIEKANKEMQYNGKFKGNEENIGASPGGRASITGIRYVKKRKKEASQNVICDYLRQARKKKGISIKEIDKILGYTHTAGHWFRKDAGGSLPSPQDWLKIKKILQFDERFDEVMTEMHYVLQTIRKHPQGKNPGDLWTIKTAKLPEEKHFSVFPEELPRIAISACCPPDGIVLDPFAGSGTTGKVARELGRKCILIELQPEFVSIIRKRCHEIRVISSDSRV